MDPGERHPADDLGDSHDRPLRRQPFGDPSAGPPRRKVWPRSAATAEIDLPGGSTTSRFAPSCRHGPGTGVDVRDRRGADARRTGRPLQTATEASSVMSIAPRLRALAHPPRPRRRRRPSSSTQPSASSSKARRKAVIRPDSLVDREAPFPAGRVDHPPAIRDEPQLDRRAASDGPGPAGSPPSPGRSGPLGSRPGALPRAGARRAARRRPRRGRPMPCTRRSGPAPSGAPRGPTGRRTRHLAGSGWSSVGQPHHAPAAGRRPAELLLQDLAVVRQQDLDRPAPPPAGRTPGPARRRAGRPRHRAGRSAAAHPGTTACLTVDVAVPIDAAELHGERPPPFVSHDGFRLAQTNRIPPTIVVRRCRLNVSGVVTPSPVGVAMR